MSSAFHDLRRGALAPEGNGFIYFLVNRNDAEFKIGSSRDPLLRIGALPEEIDVEASRCIAVSIRRMTQVEAALHLLMADYWVENKQWGGGYTEWFRLDAMPRCLKLVGDLADLIGCEDVVPLKSVDRSSASEMGSTRLPVLTRPKDGLDGNELAGGSEWRFALMGMLGEPLARRVYTAADFHELVRQFRLSASASTSRVVSEQMVSAGALRRVSSGVFLNRRATPPAELNEVASHIRAGAVISLHSVLGECGFLNNPSAVVMAVLPTSASKRPRLGEVKTSAGDTFRFYGLAERFFPSSDEERWEMLQPGRPCEMFRPEAALLQWLHLAGMQRSSLTVPPVDVDMETLDQELLGRLATKWGLAKALSDWRAKAQAMNFGEQPEASATPPSSPVTVDQAAAARARLMARRRASGG